MVCGLQIKRRRYMGFTVMSNSFKDGDYLPSNFILSADFGFGCARAFID